MSEDPASCKWRGPQNRSRDAIDQLSATLTLTGNFSDKSHGSSSVGILVRGINSHRNNPESSIITTYSATIIYFDSSYVFILHIPSSHISNSNFMVFKKTLRILCALFKFMTVARNDFKSFELSSALLERHVCQLITQVGTTFGRVESLYFHVIELCD